MKIKNNTILITGGSRGIGLALAKRFSDLDNKVIIVGKNQSNLDKAAAYNENIFTIRRDLSIPGNLELLLVELENKYPELNVLINNAGIQHNYYFLEGNSIPSRIDNEIDINFKVPLKLTAGLLPMLSCKSEAAVINVSSGLAFAPKENAPVYCATKAAIHNFSVSLRYQLEKTNIKVFEIVPSLVNTDMTKGRGKDKIEPEMLVDEFMKSFERDKYEINIGKVKLLRFLLRLKPNLALKKLRNS